jgi:hypothetical protein
VKLACRGSGAFARRNRDKSLETAEGVIARLTILLLLWRSWVPTRKSIKTMEIGMDNAVDVGNARILRYLL